MDTAIRKYSLLHKGGQHGQGADHTIDLCQTPKEVIWTKNKATLYCYVPQGERISP